MRPSRSPMGSIPAQGTSPAAMRVSRAAAGCVPGPAGQRVGCGGRRGGGEARRGAVDGRQGQSERVAVAGRVLYGDTSLLRGDGDLDGSAGAEEFVEDAIERLVCWFR